MIFLRILDRLEEILIATLMALATTIIFIAVVHRYLLGVPFLFPILFPINLSWAQELCIYMFVWVAKFGAAYGVRTGIHVGVDVVVNQVKPPWKNAIVMFGLRAPELKRGSRAYGGAGFPEVSGDRERSPQA